jgi:bifunctional DNA-binding transcriptional regulator/antitoxin component of YhaV-PrlF toxin-antitoxin module
MVPALYGQSPSKGKRYKQYWIALPKALCESMRIDKGDTLECFIERGDLILRRR